MELKTSCLFGMDTYIITAVKSFMQQGKDNLLIKVSITTHPMLYSFVGTVRQMKMKLGSNNHVRTSEFLSYPFKHADFFLKLILGFFPRESSAVASDCLGAIVTTRTSVLRSIYLRFQACWSPSLPPHHKHPSVCC